MGRVGRGAGSAHASGHDATGREGRGSTHLARFLLAEEEDDEVSDGPGEEARLEAG